MLPPNENPHHLNREQAFYLVDFLCYQAFNHCVLHKAFSTDNEPDISELAPYTLTWIGPDKLVYSSGDFRALVFLDEVTRLGDSYMRLACGTWDALYQAVLGFL
jgi:hypothetical protein